MNWRMRHLSIIVIGVCGERCIQAQQEQSIYITAMKRTQEQIQKISAHVQFETVSPATKLLEERRKMYEVDEAFQVQREQYKKQEENFKGKEEDIRKRDLEIQIHLINFCQYLQENDSKRKKAEERFKQDLQIFNKKEEEIQKLEDEISSAKEKEAKFQNKVSSLRKYEQYLEKVRSAYVDQYPEMSDILSRYQTLKKFNQTLLKDRQVMEQEKETLKKESTNFEKQMNQNILQLSNQMKDLSKRLQTKLNNKRELLSELELSRDQYEKKNLDLAKMLMAIDNLYLKCNDGIIRIKHNHEDNAQQTQKKPKPKKNEEKLPKKGEGQQVDEESNVEAKCLIAVQKIKSIFAYTKDYRTIMEQFKRQTAAQPKKQ